MKNLPLMTRRNADRAEQSEGWGRLRGRRIPGGRLKRGDRVRGARGEGHKVQRQRFLAYNTLFSLILG